MSSTITDEDLKSILLRAKTIAVVGASPKPWRASHDIMQFLLDEGYVVIPVNPSYREVLGRECYPDLRHIPHQYQHQIDIVDIFRKSDAIVPIVGDAIATGAKVIWMQSGIINEEAARMAGAAGLSVIMDRCIAVEHRLLLH